MHRIPSAFLGALFAPILICLFFVFKAFCEGECLADSFATPIFLPLVAVYKIFGNSDIIEGHEFLFVMLYWAFVGFLIGFIIDLLTHKEPEPVFEQPAFVPTPSPMPTRPPVAAKVFATPSIPIVTPIIPAAPIAPKAPLVPKAKLPINLLDRKEEDMPH